MRTAEKQWRAAEKIARKEQDDELKARIGEVRAFFTGPLRYFSQLMDDISDAGLPDNLSLPDLLGMLGGLDFDEEFDDDDFFDY